MFNFFRRKPDPVATRAADDVTSPAATPADETGNVAPAAEPASAASPALRDKRNWRDRLAGAGLSRALAGVFARNPRLDEDLLDELETALLTADVGVKATSALVEHLRRRMRGREFADADALLAATRQELLAILAPVARPLVIGEAAKPFVLMVVGVNGVGKTTTIGKLAQHLRREGAAVMLAAGDTFRAAAVQQLEVWGERNGVPVVSQGEGADSASVIFDAFQAARANGTDVLIADTAGRLHTKSGLMDELSKIGRVLRRLDENAPHEVLLVLDATTGQNALQQLQYFHQALIVTGLAITKLDGTARGGVIFAIAKEYNLPIRYVGVGESLDDLRVFDPLAYVDGILPPRFDASGIDPSA